MNKLKQYLLHIFYFLRFLLWKIKIKNNYFTASDRNEMYKYIAKNFTDNPITYWEFGVYKGESILGWAKLNSYKDSEFVGFDTFTGLPEDWIVPYNSQLEGMFNTEGIVPVTDDIRVRFIKGLFQNTLPDFLKNKKTNNQLIIHMDADLYSSTAYVLKRVHKFIKKHTIIIFDEFYSYAHEFRAFEEFVNEYKLKYTVIAGTKYLAKAAIIIEGNYPS